MLNPINGASFPLGGEVSVAFLKYAFKFSNTGHEANSSVSEF